MSPSADPAASWVLLRHEGGNTPPHYDLMLAEGDAYFTLRLPHDPFSRPLQRGERIADHPLEFFEREGALSGGKGFVRRMGRGSLEGQGPPSSGGSFRLLREDGTALRLRLERAGERHWTVSAAPESPPSGAGAKRR